MPSNEVKTAILNALVNQFPDLSQERLRPLVAGQVAHVWGNTRPQEQAAEFVIMQIGQTSLEKIVPPDTAPDRIEDAVVTHFVKLLEAKSEELLGDDDDLDDDSNKPRFPW